MQYLNKSFTVGAMVNRDVYCRCGQLIKVGYITKQGTLCQGCYNADKSDREREKIEKILPSS